MTSYGPSPSQLSLYERLIGAPLVVIGRVRGIVEEWPDPADGSLRFGLLDIKVKRALRGETEKGILVRIPGKARKGEVQWAAPVEEGAKALFLLSPDENDGQPRYALQHGSAFFLHDDALDLPRDLALGEYAEEGDRPRIEMVLQMLDDIAAAEAERSKHYESLGGPDWEKAEYRPVEEMGAAFDGDEEERPSRPQGPRPGWPSTGRQDRRSRS